MRHQTGGMAAVATPPPMLWAWMPCTDAEGISAAAIDNFHLCRHYWWPAAAADNADQTVGHPPPSPPPPPTLWAKCRVRSFAAMVPAADRVARCWIKLPSFFRRSNHAAIAAGRSRRRDNQGRSHRRRRRCPADALRQMPFL